jgi:nucleotide-binding universal stress UspA family protein
VAAQDREVGDMQTVDPGLGTHRRVVVGVDDSGGGVAALRHAVGMARADKAELVAVRSWALGLPRHGGHRHRRWGSDHRHVVLYFNGDGQREASAMLVRRAFRYAGGFPRDITLTIETPEGDPGRVLTDIATVDGDVLVVGSEHDHHVKRLVHGSVSRYCRDHARCPVVVVPSDGTTD